MTLRLCSAARAALGLMAAIARSPDMRAPYRQYVLTVEALEKHGKQFESKSYPNEPHGSRNAANRVDMYQRLESFFDRHLTGHW